nr:hypothetical protein CFP56_22981 [Quercus suber]
MSLKKVIYNFMTEFREAAVEVDLAKWRVGKAGSNAERVFEKLKVFKVLPISNLEEVQFVLYLRTKLAFAGKGKISSNLSAKTRGELVQFAALHQLLWLQINWDQ